MGKPKRIVSQKTTDTICTYAATVNLAGSKAKFGTHSDFVAWFKNHYKKKMITKERTAMYERRVAKLKFKGEEAKQELKKNNQGILEKSMGSSIFSRWWFNSTSIS